MYEINAKSRKSAEVLIYEDIGEGGMFGGLGAKQFAADVRKLGKLDTLNVRINSIGGSVFEGLTIYNTLERHPARVEVDIDGIAASIASLIAMAGDTVRIAENGFLMIHRAWGGVMGNAESLRETASRLEKVDGVLASTYSGRTGIDSAEISAMMDAETWMEGPEAVRLGFADQTTGPQSMAAMAMLNGSPVPFRNLPEPLKPPTRRQQARAAVVAMSERLRARGLTEGRDGP